MDLRLPEWEIVHTLDDWYDGPRAGAADYKGAAYWYRSIYLDSDDWNPDEDRFELTRLSADALAWEIELKAIFEAWNSARETGLVEWAEDDGEISFGALPADRVRYHYLKEKLGVYLAETEPERLVIGRFKYQPLRVRWEDPITD